MRSEKSKYWLVSDVFGSWLIRYFESGFTECSEGDGDCEQDSDCMGPLASNWYLVFEQVFSI